MIRSADIQEKLFHLIGWKQGYNTADLKIADWLTESESGLYFQQFHPLLTLEAISSIAPDFKNTDYPEYSPEKTYEAGNVVKYNDLLYKALQETKGQTPDNAEYWVETDPFSEWLADKTKSSIQHAISRYYLEKMSDKTAKSLCENKVLFDGTGRLVDTVKNQNNLVGFEIVPVRAKGVTVKINKIGLQFTKPGSYTLYLMHSGVDLPVKVFSLEKVKANSIEWLSLADCFLPYYSDRVDVGGSWYLVYSQNTLPNESQAIFKNIDWSKGPCPGCSRREYVSWQGWSKYIEIHPFYVNLENVDIDDNGLHMWDVENNIYTYDNNYGLNLEVTVACDITDFIIEQRQAFIDVIGKQLAVDMLREFAYNANVRTNRHSINASRLDILYELDGDSSSMKKSGLSYQLDNAFKAVKVDTLGIDRVCLPCKNNGIKFVGI